MCVLVLMFVVHAKSAPKLLPMCNSLEKVNVYETNLSVLVGIL